MGQYDFPPKPHSTMEEEMPTEKMKKDDIAPEDLVTEKLESPISANENPEEATTEKIPGRQAVLETARAKEEVRERIAKVPPATDTLEAQRQQESQRRLSVLEKQIRELEVSIEALGQGNALRRWWNANERQTQQERLVRARQQHAEVKAQYPNLRPGATATAANNMPPAQPGRATRWNPYEGKGKGPQLTLEQQQVDRRYKNLLATIAQKQELIRRMGNEQPRPKGLRYELDNLKIIIAERDSVYNKNKEFLDRLASERAESTSGQTVKKAA